MTTLPDPVPEVQGSLELDLGEMTLGMMEWMEEALGCSLATFDQDRYPTRMTIATIYARRKALDRTYTLEQAENLPVSTLLAVAEALHTMADTAGTPDPQVP